MSISFKKGDTLVDGENKPNDQPIDQPTSDNPDQIAEGEQNIHQETEGQQPAETAEATQPVIDETDAMVQAAAEIEHEPEITEPHLEPTLIDQSPPPPEPPVAMNPQVVGLPPQPGQPQMPGQPMATKVARQPMDPKKKKTLAIGAGAAALVLGVAFYFVQYLPNTPDNVWRRGVASIGVGLEEISDDGTIKLLENTNFEGSLSVEKPISMSASVSGNFELKGNAAFNLSVKYDKYNPKLEAIYRSIEDSYPNLYFKFSGIKTIIDDQFGQDTFDSLVKKNDVENIWWLLDYNELLEKGLIEKSDLDDALSAQSSQLTQDDWQKLSKAALDASNEYVFTADTENMVLQQVESLGKDDYEGQSSQKYRVEVNKDNLKKYIKTVRDNMQATGVVDKLQLDKPLNELLKDEDIDKFVDEEVDFSDVKIEAWVGLNNKVLRNIRFTPIKESGTYVDVSLLLDDTNLEKIPIRIKIVGDDESSAGFVEFNFIADYANNVSEMSMEMNIDYKNEYDDDIAMAMILKATGTEEAPAQVIPENPQSFIDFIYNDLGLGEAGL